MFNLKKIKALKEENANLLKRLLKSEDILHMINQEYFRLLKTPQKIESINPNLSPFYYFYPENEWRCELSVKKWATLFDRESQKALKDPLRRVMTTRETLQSIGYKVN